MTMFVLLLLLVIIFMSEYLQLTNYVHPKIYLFKQSQGCHMSGKKFFKVREKLVNFILSQEKIDIIFEKRSGEIKIIAPAGFWPRG